MPSAVRQYDRMDPASQDRRIRIGSLIHSDAGAQQSRVPYVDSEKWEGRLYNRVDGNVVYPFPRDDNEHERLDIIHSLVHDVALGNRLYLSDLRPADGPTDRIQNALDVGFGTGIWVYEMALKHPRFEVIGIDLFAKEDRTSEKIKNARFQYPMDFTARDWPFPKNHFDFIRNANLAGSVPDWQAHWTKVFRYLKPGGFAEYIEIDWALQCPRGFSPPPEILRVYEWWERLKQAALQFGKPITYPEDTEVLLESAGFSDITHKTVKIPIKTRAWGDGREERMTEWLKTSMYRPDEDGKANESLEGMSMWLLCTQLGIPPQHVRMMCTELKRICDSTQLPVFYNLHIWTAQKP